MATANPIRAIWALSRFVGPRSRSMDRYEFRDGEWNYPRWTDRGSRFHRYVWYVRAAFYLRSELQEHQIESCPKVRELVEAERLYPWHLEANSRYSPVLIDLGCDTCRRFWRATARADRREKALFDFEFLEPRLVSWLKPPNPIPARDWFLSCERCGRRHRPLSHPDKSDNWEAYNRVRVTAIRKAERALRDIGRRVGRPLPPVRVWSPFLFPNFCSKRCAMGAAVESVERRVSGLAATEIRRQVRRAGGIRGKTR